MLPLDFNLLSDMIVIMGVLVFIMIIILIVISPLEKE